MWEVSGADQNELKGSGPMGIPMATTLDEFPEKSLE